MWGNLDGNAQEHSERLQHRASLPKTIPGMEKAEDKTCSEIQRKFLQCQEIPATTSGPGLKTS